jgi:hypothetical protein
VRRLWILLFLAAFAVSSATIGIFIGWKFIASDACLDAGGRWREAGSVCVGLHD